MSIFTQRSSFNFLNLWVNVVAASILAVPSLIRASPSFRLQEPGPITNTVTVGEVGHSAPIPFSELGAKATAEYRGDALRITATAEGAELRTGFQQLLGSATSKGFWVSSTDTNGGRLRLTASSIGRADRSAANLLNVTALPESGTVVVGEKTVVFNRPGLTEEYSVSVDGVRQDFVIADRPSGQGELRVELALTGGQAEAAAYGVKLTLEQSQRELAYSRLRVVDATGRELAARMEVSSAQQLVVSVADEAAAYPVRIDPTFSDADWVSMNRGIAGANDAVRAVVVDAAGDVYIGGDFTFVGSVAANHIAKWDSRTLSWSALGDGTSGGGWWSGRHGGEGGVHALAFIGGDLYAGGAFTSAGGRSASHIAKWDSRTLSWSPLANGVDGWVNALAVIDGDLYVGGSFPSADGQPANCIAKWDARVLTWSPLGGGVSRAVNALAVSGNDLYVGGSFTQADGRPANHIAKWDSRALTWSPLGGGVSGGVYALAVSGDDLYVGGTFTEADERPANHIAKWDSGRLTWSALGEGLLNGGDFTLGVFGLAVSGDDLYVGGSFNEAGGRPAGHIAKWDSRALTWSTLGSGMTTPPVFSLAVNGSNLYVGGGNFLIEEFRANFWLFEDRVNVAKWDTRTLSWSGLSDGMNYPVRVVAVSGSDLYVGGDFTFAGGRPANHIAKWDSRELAWSALGEGVNGRVLALAVIDRDLYAGGTFDSADGRPAKHVAKWDSHVHSWSPLGEGTVKYVNSLAVIGGNLYVGGGDCLRSVDETSISCEFVGGNSIAKWDTRELTWSPLGGGVSGRVHALAVSGDDLYVGGYFTQADGRPANHIAKWDSRTLTWSPLGGGVSDWVHALAVSGNDLYVGGTFTSAGGRSANHIAKWDTRALSWSRLGGGLNGSVYALATDAANHLFVGGDFLFAGTTLSPYVVQANINRVTQRITGQVDMVGETEAAGTRVSAAEGPGGAGATHTLAAPYFGDFSLEPLPASTATDPAKDYKVWAELNFGTGHRHQFFKTPVLGEGLNAAVNLPADGDRRLGFQFVMYPGYLEGNLLLKGPAESLLGHPSPLRGIVRLNEPGADYSLLPDNLDSRVFMLGKDQLAPTAATTAAGGFAYTSFEGEFNPATSAFVGDYRFALAGLNGARTLWEHLFTRLLLRAGSATEPESYVNHTLFIQELVNSHYDQTIEVVAGQRQSQDLNYCFSELAIEVETPSGTLWNPTMQMIGSFYTPENGLDFQGNYRWYQAETRAAVGSPNAPGVSSRGRLVVMLPEGEYPIVVTAPVENPPGTITTNVFDLGKVRVGCGERLQISSGLQLQITHAPDCGGGEPANIVGKVATPPGISVSQISWRGSDGVEHLLCSDCGENPAFNFPVAFSGSCADTMFTVTARTADGRSASSTRTLRDTLPPVITVGADKTVPCGTPWSFDPVTATDACSGTVPTEIVSTVTNILSPGITAVDRTWRATDACGNAREAKQRVTVNAFPVVYCPGDIFRDCPGRVTWTAGASDCRNLTSFDCVPPSGTFFAAGVHTVVCRAVNADGLSSECRFNITVAEHCALPVVGGGAAEMEGAAQAETRADGSMRLHNLGSSGNDGMRLNFGNAEGIRVNFDRSIPAGSMPTGAVFRVTTVDLGGAEGPSLSLERNGSFPVMEVIPDFRAQQSGTNRMRFYNGSQLVYETSLRAPTPPNQFPLRNQVFLDALPVAVRVANLPNRGVTFECLLGGPPVPVSIYTDGNSVYLMADRMEVDSGSVATTAISTPLSALDLRFSGVDERIITATALTRFGHEVRASQGVLLSSSGDTLILRAFPAPTGPIDLLTWPTPPLAWKPLSPVGYFEDLAVENPSGYSGYWKDPNPLGYSADWDVKFDLTDKASASLQQPQRFRPGKSSAALKVIAPMDSPGAELRFVAGGLENTLPGSASVEMGSLLFQEKGGKLELSAEFPNMVDTSGTPWLRREIVLANGTTRVLEGVGLSVRFETLELPQGHLEAQITPDGGLALALNLEGKSVHALLEDAEAVEAVSFRWVAVRAAEPNRWGAASLRALLLAGKSVRDLTVVNLTTSRVNPTPSLYFSGQRVRALGNASYRLDALGALAISGLSQTGADGISIDSSPVTEFQVNPPPSAAAAGSSEAGSPTALASSSKNEGQPVELGSVNLGYLPVSSGQFPRLGASIDFRWVGPSSSDPSAEDCCPVYARLGGENLNDGGPIFLATRFPALKSTHHRLRMFHGGQLVYEQSGRANEAEGNRGNLLPTILPDGVAATEVDGQFTWVLRWNRPIYVTCYDPRGGGDFLGDRVEVMAEEGAQVPVAPGYLQLRASHIDTLRLLNLGDRTAPLVPRLNFGFANGRLTLDWFKTANGIPKIELSPTIDGPWRPSVGFPLSREQWRFEMDTSAGEGYTRLVTADLSEGCLNFSTQEPGERPNPWELMGWRFDRFDIGDTHARANQILEFSETHALELDSRMNIELPSPAREVDLGFVHFGSLIRFEAFDDLGQADEVFVSTPSITDHAELVTLRATEDRPLRRVKLTSVGNSVHLRELCLRPFISSDVSSNLACLPLRTAAEGAVPNPWVQGDLTFTASDASGLLPHGRISPYGGSLPGYDTVGYEVAYRVELSFAHPCPFVELEFLSGSGRIDFQPYDDLDTPLPLYRLNRVTATSGETVTFTGSPRGIRRIVITTPNALTRLLKICCGSAPAPFCREAAILAARPLRNPEPVGDTVWTFYTAAGGLASSSSIRTDPGAGEAGFELTSETVIEFATDQQAVELRLLVVEGGATLSAEATTLGGRNAVSLPEATYATGVHSLTLTDYCIIGCGENIRRVRIKLSHGKVIVSRVCTPKKSEN